MGHPRGRDTMESIATKDHRSARPGRVAVLLGLVFAAAVTLRGLVPEAQRGPRDQATDSPTTLAGVITLLSVSMLIMGIALFAAMRRPQRAVASAHRDLPDRLTEGRSRMGLRLLLIALGLVLAFVLAFVLAHQLRLGPDLGQTTPSPDAGADGAAPAPAPAALARPHRDAFWYLVATSVVMTVMIAVTGIITARRRIRPEPMVVVSAPASAPGPAPEPLEVAAERGLAEVGDHSREPREAIIACYAAMEQALAAAPGAAPQAWDTPTEVLERAMASRTLGAGHASSLVELFTEARFSRHVMTEDHRDTAERALRSVLGELRGPSVSRS